jgi:hypothetical protein
MTGHHLPRFPGGIGGGTCHGPGGFWGWRERQVSALVGVVAMAASAGATWLGL